jgi:hypothetical protein
MDLETAQPAVDKMRLGFHAHKPNWKACAALRPNAVKTKKGPFSTHGWSLKLTQSELALQQSTAAGCLAWKDANPKPPWPPR